MNLVRKFLQVHETHLLNCISDLRQGKLLEEDLQQLVEIENEWRAIPLEEKQIPYQDGEEQFWYAYRTLRALLNPKPLVNPRGEILSKRRPSWEIISGDLELAEDGLRNRSKLPADKYAKRILP
jgi:hypothetical protein